MLHQPSEPFGTAQAQVFNALPHAARVAELRADVEQLQTALATRARRGGAAKLNIMVMDLRMGSAHLHMSSMMRALLEDPSDPLAALVRVGRSDIFGSETANTYEVPFDTCMAREQGRRLALRHLRDYARMQWYYKHWGRWHLEHTLRRAMRRYEMAGIDVIISVQSFALAGLARLARDVFGAQLRALPTDFSLADWTVCIGPFAKATMHMRYDLATDDRCVTRRLHRLGLHNYGVVGLPVRPAFSALGLRRADPQASADAETDIQNVLRNLSQNSWLPCDRAVTLIMGGKGGDPQRLLHYMKLLDRLAPTLVEANQTLHIFVPGARGPSRSPEFSQVLQQGARLLHKATGASSVRVHLLDCLCAEPLAHLLAGSVCITKAGGLTAYEIAAVGGKALFNMLLTRFLRWEMGNVTMLEKHRLGVRLPVRDTDERVALGPALRRLWAAPALPLPLPSRDFAQTFKKALLHDTLRRL